MNFVYFQTEICRLLIYRFLDVPEFQNVTLKCLTEIASISKENTREYQQVNDSSLIMTSYTNDS